MTSQPNTPKTMSRVAVIHLGVVIVSACLLIGVAGIFMRNRTDRVVVIVTTLAAALLWTVVVLILRSQRATPAPSNAPNMRQLMLFSLALPGGLFSQELLSRDAGVLRFGEQLAASFAIMAAVILIWRSVDRRRRKPDGDDA